MTAFECPLPIGIQARTRLRLRQSFPEMRATVERLASCIHLCFTILPYEKKTVAYPHGKGRS